MVARRRRSKPDTVEEDSNRTVFRLDNVQLCFPDGIFEKPIWDGERAKQYELGILLDPEEHEASIEELYANVDEMIDNELEGEEPENRLCAIKDDTMHSKRGMRPEFEGKIYIKAKSKHIAKVVDRQLKPMAADDERLYGGCRATVKISPWCSNGKNGPTIGYNLMVVQWTGNDEPFGSGAVSDEEALDGLESLEPDDDLYGDDEQPKRRSRRRGRTSDDEADQEEAPKRRRRRR